MEGFLRRTWATVDLDCVAHNYRVVRSAMAPGCRMMAIIKADAYGHGDMYLSRELDTLGADCFGVSNINEALLIRSYGVIKPVLILGHTPAASVATLAAYRITQTVFSAEYARSLSAAAVAAGVRVNIHIKVDTGMARLGFACDPGGTEEIESACRLPGLIAEGIFTHFSRADELNPEGIAYTREQFARFMAVCESLEKQGVTFALRHCCNSAGLLSYPDMQLDMVRPGIILYGLLPGPDCRGKLPLRPVMALESVVAMVREFPTGTKVSYGSTYTTDKARRLAVIPIGYADGYHRVLSGHARMLAGGRLAPVVGRVCMDQTIIDVTDAPGVSAGDVVTVMGGDGPSAEDIAQLAGTIGYEVVCTVGKRVSRLYRRHGRNIGFVDQILSENGSTE